MAAPNIVSVTSVIGKTKVADVTNTLTPLLENAADSDKMLKISTLIVANISDNPATVDVVLTKIEQNNAAVVTKIAHEIVVPKNAALTIANRDTPIYMEEATELSVAANVNDALHVTCAYEEVM